MAMTGFQTEALKGTLRSVIFEEITTERYRQDSKFGWVENPASKLPSDDNGARLAVVMEELGEVARAILDHEGRERVWEELIQVAACCVAWIEADRFKDTVALTGERVA